MNAKWIVASAALALSASAQASDRIESRLTLHFAVLDDHADGDLATAAPPRVVPELEDLMEGGGDMGRSPVVTDALYGLLAGLIVGAGVALIEGGNFGRDLAIGAGAGLVVGGVIGGLSSMADIAPMPVATDGLGSPSRAPIVPARGIALAGQF